MRSIVLAALLCMTTAPLLAQEAEPSIPVPEEPDLDVERFVLETRQNEWPNETRRQNVSRFVSILRDTATGEEYLVIRVPGNETIVVHRAKAHPTCE